MTTTMSGSATVERCWEEIGVFGDGSCPRLQSCLHCHDCSVYAGYGRRLFDRAPPAEYLADRASLLSGAKDDAGGAAESAVVFRLGAEWFALPSVCIREVAMPAPVHVIPHRSSRVLLGLVNITGGLELCVSLHALLGPDAAPREEDGARRRLVVFAHAGQTWVFPVEEVQGVQPFERASIQPPPVTVARAAATYTRGVITGADRSICFLDTGLVGAGFQRSIQ